MDDSQRKDAQFVLVYKTDDETFKTLLLSDQDAQEIGKAMVDLNVKDCWMFNAAENPMSTNPIAVADGGTGASIAAGALTNLGAVPTTRTVNGKSLSFNITLGASDVGALASTTTYGASLEADREDISFVDQNGDTLATAQTQDISQRLDKQSVYSSLGVTSRFFHEEDGSGSPGGHQR